jgi:integrase
MSVFKRPGQAVYSYDFQFRGRRFSGSTGSSEKRKAERFEQEERERLKQSEVDAAGPVTFQVAIARYWNEVGQHHRNAVDTDRAIEWLETYVGPKTPIADINDGMVAKLVARRRGQQNALKAGSLVSAATVNRSVCEPLRAILRRASKVWKLKVEDIDWKTHILREPQERVREASQVEESRLLETIRGDYAPALKFALLTGARRLEIVTLEWTAVDLINRTIRIRGKGDRLRTIPMTKAVFELLWSLKNDHPLAVFTYMAKKTRDGRCRGTRYPITEAGFKTAWRRCKETAGVSDFRFHDTRHTAATRLVRATGNIRLAQRLLGHSDIATTTRYAHVTQDDLLLGMEASEAAAIHTANPTEARATVSKYKNSNEN